MLLCQAQNLPAESDSSKTWHNALTPQGQPAAPLALAENGRSHYRIVIPRRASRQDQKAAEELRHWLREMTGATLPIVREGTWFRFGPRFMSIGRTRALERSRLPGLSADLGDEGYGIGVKGKRLFLWGGRTRGAINAVFALLEEDLGCRWYTRSHARIPSVKTLTFAPVPRTYTPALKLRDPFYFVAFDEDWSLRNRTNAPRAVVREEWGGHIDYGGRFVHTFHSLLPPEEYFDKHPEYYMMDAAGNRDPHQLCTTHPDVLRLVTREVIRYLKRHPEMEIVSVSKSDGGRTCLCSRCKALDEAEGTNMAALLRLVNQVAEAIEEDYPDVVVSTLAYLETIGVPKTARPRENVAIRLCNDTVGAWSHPFTPAAECPFGEILKAWSAAHDRIYIWDYTVNFSHYMAPMPNMEVIADNIRFQVEHHVEGIMTQGAYQSPGGERDEMRSWVIAKLLWDPARDLFELTQDFIYGHYGKAAPAIAEYNELLRRQGEQFKDALARPPGGIRYGMDHPFLSKEFLEAAAELFARAETLAESEEVLHRVERASMPILYVKLVRGPEFAGEEYGKVLERFETIARREKAVYLSEVWGAPDLEQKLNHWQGLWQQYSEKPSPQP